MNKSSLWYLVAIIGIFISIQGIICAVTSPITTMSATVQNIYTLKWNGNDTDLTAVYSSGNVTVHVIHGENFAVNGSTIIYDNENSFVARLP